MPPEKPKSWFKGIVTNLLRQHPWFFWLTGGTDTLANAITQSWLDAGAFLFGCYFLLVRSKMVVALLAAKSGNLLAGQLYQVVMRFLAVLLACFALLLFHQSWRQLTFP